MSESDPGDRPNVLLVVADDMRFDAVSAVGDDRIETPTLDALVERGCTLTRHHNLGSTQGAVCVPARSMIHSGRSLFRLDGPGGMTTDHATLPEAFGEAGYRTFHTGKWHNGREAFNRCFDEGEAIYFGGMGNHWNLPVCSRYPLGEYPDPRPARVDFGSGTVIPVRQVYDRYESGTHATELFADAAIEFVEDAAGEDPFFASLATTAPHDPRSAPGEYVERYDPDDLPTPESFVPEHPFLEWDGRDENLEHHPRDPERVRRHLADYYAMITHLDAELGRVFDALEEAGERENTLVVVTADHGLAVGRHGLMGKQNVYDHSLRVPLLVAGPGVPEGERRDALTAHPDLHPTLRELAGLDAAPESVDGESRADLIRGDESGGRDAMFGAYGDGQRAIREGDLKLHEYRLDGDEYVRLYDLAEDPHETSDLSEERPEATERLRERLRERQRAAEDPHAGDW